jgi:hypothetical protein
VEIWFGIFSRKALRGASFKSIEQLRQAIEAFVTAYGPTAKPFMWRKREVKGSQLKNTIVNCCNKALVKLRVYGHRKQDQLKEFWP